MSLFRPKQTFLSEFSFLLQIILIARKHREKNSPEKVQQVSTAAMNQHSRSWEAFEEINSNFDCEVRHNQQLPEGGREGERGREREGESERKGGRGKYRPTASTAEKSQNSCFWYPGENSDGGWLPWSTRSARLSSFTLYSILVHLTLQFYYLLVI